VRQEGTAGGSYATPSSIMQLRKKKNPNKRGETKGEGCMCHTLPLLTILPQKKKNPPNRGGNKPEWGRVPPPSMKKRKITRQHVDAHCLVDLLGEGLWGERKKETVDEKKRENETVCGKHAASSMSQEGGTSRGENQQK